MAEQEIFQSGIGLNRRDADLLIICESASSVFADRRRRAVGPPWPVLLEFQPGVRIRVGDPAGLLLAASASPALADPKIGHPAPWGPTLACKHSGARIPL
jgi:hypothetical protein